MEFVNGWMLLGLLAVAIPVVIHLLNRKSARTVQWGAWRFLKSSVLQRRRRVLLEEMLLLACRCLAVALFAFALARPFLPSSRKLDLGRFARGAARDIVVVLDGSSSMTLLQGAESNFEIARKEAADLVKAAPRGTAFGILLGGPVPQALTPALVSDKREVFAALDAARPAQGTMNVHRCLTAAVGMLLGGANPVKQVVVFGDGQAAGWDATATDRWKVMRSVFAQLPAPPPVLWRTLPLPASVRNVAATSVMPSREIIGTDREVAFRVNVANTGTEAVTPREVRLDVEGKTLANRTVGQLEPGASETVVFRHRFGSRGAQTVTATVVADDDLPADDSATTVVSVIENLKVLLVDGNPDAPRFDRASTYLALALRPDTQQPPTGTLQLATSNWQLEVATAPALESRTGLADCAVIALCDVPRLPDRVAARLADFVAAGGGLLVAPGARARPEFYDAWTHEGEPVLPLPLSELDAAPDSANAPTLAPETFSGELLRALRDGSDLGQVVAERRWLLDEGSASGTATVEGRFTDGTPAFAVRELGRGRVVLSALPLDASLSQLPSRSHFVPLVHEIAAFLAHSSTADLNLVPSDGATILLAAPGRAGSAEEHGLRGIYYRRKGFQGMSIQRIDDAIDFDWGEAAPLKRIPRDNFSIRWTGSLTPPETGTYEFALRVDDRATLTIGDKEIGSSSFTREPKPVGAVSLVGGKPVAIRIDFEEDGGEAAIRLDWKSDAIPLSPVPSDVLRPDPPDDAAEADDPAQKGTASMSVDVTAPDSAVFAATLTATEQGPALRIERPLTPGVYRARSPIVGADDIAPLVGPDGTIPFVVRGDADESDLTALPQEGQDAIRPFVELVTATTSDDLLKAVVGGRSFGNEVWRLLAYATLLLLVGEIFLTRWIAIQRKTGEA